MLSGILGNAVLVILFAIFAGKISCDIFVFCLVFLIIGNVLWIISAFLQGGGLVPVILGIGGIVFMSIALIMFHNWVHTNIPDDPGFNYVFLPLSSILFCFSYNVIGEWGDNGLSIGLTIGMFAIYSVLFLVVGDAGFVIGYIAYGVAILISLIRTVKGGSSAWG